MANGKGRAKVSIKQSQIEELKFATDNEMTEGRNEQKLRTLWPGHVFGDILPGSNNVSEPVRLSRHHSGESVIGEKFVYHAWSF